MSAALPRRLRWIQPLMKQLAAIPPDELNEDHEIAVSLVEHAIDERAAGLSDRKRKQRLSDDLRALAQWLSAPGQDMSPGHFVRGYLIGMLGFPAMEPSETATAPGAAVPSGRTISVDLPPEFQVTASSDSLIAVGGGLLAQFFRTEAISLPLLGELVHSGAESLKEKLLADGMTEGRAERTLRDMLRQHGEAEVEVRPVRFDAVRGLKCVLSVNAAAGRQRIVHYGLEVPGGYVHVTITAFAALEEAIEGRLQTLRVSAG